MITDPSQIKKTDPQCRAWLQVKLENYMWHIKGRNAYGSKKGLMTISKDLHRILDEFDRIRGTLV